MWKRECITATSGARKRTCISGVSRVLDRNGPLAPCRRRIKSRKPSRVLVHAPLTVTKLGIVDQRLDHGVRVVLAPCVIEPQFNLADRIFICLGHDDLSHLAAVHARTQLLFAASRLRSVPMLPPRPRTVDPVWSPRRVLERIIHANARRIYGNVQRMRALPAPALVVHREANDEARSDRYRKRGYFGCDRRGGDRECTILSPLRPCSNLYLACLYPPNPRLDSSRGRSAHDSVCRPEQSGGHRRW